MPADLDTPGRGALLGVGLAEEGHLLVLDRLVQRRDNLLKRRAHDVRDAFALRERRSGKCWNRDHESDSERE